MKRIMILLLLLCGVACAAGFSSYRSSLGFTVQYPNGWQVSTSKTDVQFQALGNDQLILAEFGIGVRPLRTLEAWVKLRKQETALPDGSSAVESVRDLRLAGRPAKRLVVFSFDRSIAEEAVVVGGRLFVVYYDFDNPNDANFKAHQAMYKRMRDSLRF
jgi:hypothetical protein